MKLPQLSIDQLLNNKASDIKSFGSRPQFDAFGGNINSREGGRGMAALSDALQTKLSRFPQTQPVEIDNPYAPDKVAEKVAGFINNHLQRERAAGASDERLQELYDIGMEAVDEGFAEARTILDQMGILGGKIEEDINTTYDLFQQAAQKMHDNLFGVVERPPELSSEGLQASSLYRAESIEVSQSFEFELLTAEGDRVTINMERSAGAASESYARQEGSSLSTGYSYEAYQQGSFAFQVDGDLNEQELAAIDSLLSQVGDLSETFYEGNLGEAFDKALSLGYDAEQISSFSLDLTQTTQYQMVEQYRNNQPAQETQVPTGVRELVEYVRGLQDALEAAANFQEPKALLEKLMEMEDSLRVPEDQAAELIPQHQDINRQLLENIS